MKMKNVLTHYSTFSLFLLSLLWLFILNALPLQGAIRIKRLYTIYSPSHEVLYNNWFLPSLKDDYEVVVKMIRQNFDPQNFLSIEWGATMLQKVELILAAIKAEWGGMFIYSDVDIQFFRSFRSVVEPLMDNKDIIFQRDNPQGTKCAGFFVCRANEVTLALWQKVKKYMLDRRMNCDQTALNAVIGTSKVRWDFLPSEFFGGGTFNNHHWNPGDSLPIPQNAIMHHANYTIGIENKLLQLQYVRQIVINHNVL
jgi:hypothetical protein